MPITALGTGSGIDLKNLLTQLVAAERAPYENRYNRQEAQIQAKISAYGTLKGVVASLRSPLDRLSRFQPTQQVSVSDSDALSVLLNGPMPNGSFRVQINQLATAQAVATEAGGPFANSSTVVIAAGSSATVSIQVGTGAAQTVTLDASTDENGVTLAELRNAINEAGAGVTASIINNGTEARLVLTANQTGAANTIQMSVTGTLFDEELSIDGVTQGTITQPAQDALVEINGVPVTSASNTLDNAIAGATLTLKKVTTTPVTATVSNDRSSLAALLNEFVGAYNELVKQTDDLTRYDSENKRASLLTGDTTVRSIRNALRNALGRAGGPEVWETDVISGAKTAFRLTLSHVGVTMDRSGQLSFNSGKLDTAVNRYGADSVAAAINEIASNLKGVADSFNDPLGGQLKARTDGLNATVKIINEQRARLNERMEEYEYRLNRQFSNLDKLIAKMNNTSNYLGTQLGNLKNLSNGK